MPGVISEGLPVGGVVPEHPGKIPIAQAEELVRGQLGLLPALLINGIGWVRQGIGHRFEKIFRQLVNPGLLFRGDSSACGEVGQDRRQSGGQGGMLRVKGHDHRRQDRSGISLTFRAC